MRASVTVVASLLSLVVSVSGQGEFQTVFCQTIDGKHAASNNFCQAVGGAVLPSPGFCCLRSSDFDKFVALSKGCADNGLVLGKNDVPCSP
ncbi:hypothetical protein CGCSCA4_v003887 [Colletotrichum siamense]|uniref:Uncharacterized protein n=1 Tax=Colletotrichum siamense TaxID=690259 RepID=A0A9P5EZU8_COLSI|nr:hypothetical protein CGCSCA4_v003887 [Colletotrichum siamense]KAF4862595.1 hypothetical protein CGCSCA2_v003633 [Colletotrichum siamense]